MSLEEFGALVKEVGFPIAVAGWVLWRLNGKMDRLSEALHKLIAQLERQTQRAEVDHIKDAERQARILDEVTRRGSM